MVITVTGLFFSTRTSIIPSLDITEWYRSKVFAWADEPVPETGKGWGLFCSDWREGDVFSPLIYGGSRSPEPVEGNGSQQNSPVDKWSEKTSPGALGTKEKVPALSMNDPPTQTLLNDTKRIHILFLSNCPFDKLFSNCID
jgi:hypothetical protein